MQADYIDSGARARRIACRRHAQQRLDAARRPAAPGSLPECTGKWTSDDGLLA